MSDLERVCDVSGINLGSHTWSHPNLTQLAEKELKEELNRSLNWLRARFDDRVIPWLSLPYGKTDSRVQAAVRESKYRGAVRVSGGLKGPDTDPTAVPRVNIPSGLSLDGFVLRIAGL